MTLKPIAIRAVILAALLAVGAVCHRAAPPDHAPPPAEGWGETERAPGEPAPSEPAAGAESGALGRDGETWVVTVRGDHER